MSNKLFGEYLVEGGHVKADDLVKALVQQQKLAKSPAEVVFESKILSAADILLVMGEQSRNQIEFRRAASEIGKWNAEFEKKLDQGLRQSRPPIGEILVKNGATTYEILTRALDEFLSSHVNEAPKAQVFSSPAAVVQPAAAVQSSTVVFSQQVDQSLAAGYCELVTPDFASRFLTSMEFIESSPTDLVVEALSHDVHQVVGVAVLAQLGATSKLLKLFEQKYSAASAKLSSDGGVAIKVMALLAKPVMRWCESVAASLAVEQAEVFASKNQELSAVYQDILAKLEGAK